MKQEIKINHQKVFSRSGCVYQRGFKMKKYKKIEIEWIDITLFKGVYEESDLKGLQEQHIKTIGYLIKEEEDYLIIAFSVEVTEPYRFLDLYKIPKSNIIKKEVLK